MLQDVEIPLFGERDVDEGLETGEEDDRRLSRHDSIDVCRARSEWVAGELRDVVRAVGADDHRRGYRVHGALELRRENSQERDLTVRSDAEEIIAAGVHHELAGRLRPHAERVAVDAGRPTDGIVVDFELTE